MLDFRFCAVIYCNISSLDAETGDKQAEWVDNKILISDRMGRSSMGCTEWPNYEFWKLVLQMDLHLSTSPDTTD